LRTVAKIWHLMPHDRDAVERLSKSRNLSPIVSQLLLNRGIHDPERIDRFLNVRFKGLHPPEMLPGVPQAADCIYNAVRQGKRICVYGDYDVDGLTGTALLWQTLRLLGGIVDFYVPHRLEEGYGLNADALTQIAGLGTSVVVTVDCGITSVAEAELAKNLGMKLIVTDHHEVKSCLPDAAALVHSRLPGSSYPFGDLSGSGVAFKLAWALCQRASGAEKVNPEFREFLQDTVALAALGMVADWVPLQDENRIIVKHGLARLRRTSSIGLKALIEGSHLGGKTEITSSDISFAIAPRLNAAGRLGCARLVVELLTTTCRERAHELMCFLDNQNSDRQKIERKILAQAHEMVAGLDLDRHPALVLASPDWHPGVIGIVAGRLVEIYSRPVLMIALRGEENPGHGSGRSVPGFLLHEALDACGDYLLSHGGHAAAAGFRIEPERVEEFRNRFCSYAGEQFPNGPSSTRLVIDAEVSLGLLTPGVIEALSHLEPYGCGNPRPLFMAGPVQVVGTPRRVGKGERHLQFRVQQEAQIPAIAFGLADRVEELMSAGGQCFVVFTPNFNEWQGRRTVQLEVTDFRAGTRARLG